MVPGRHGSLSSDHPRQLGRLTPWRVSSARVVFARVYLVEGLGVSDEPQREDEDTDNCRACHGLKEELVLDRGTQVGVERKADACTEKLAHRRDDGDYHQRPKP